MEYSISDRELQRLKIERQDAYVSDESVCVSSKILTDKELQSMVKIKRKRKSTKALGASKRSKSSDARTLPFIVYNNGQYELGAEAVQMIENINEPFAVIAVVGKYRTGKSFFLNRVLLNNEGTDPGFTVGSSIQACTKGLWVYSETVMCRDKFGKEFRALIIDTEGISALDADSTHDTRVFSLALLLSSYFIYNSTGAIDEEAINNLSLVVKVSDHLRLSAASEELSGGAAPDYFPSFLWIVRDFTLRLLNSEGCAITETQYLEDALRITGSPTEDKNRVRECLLRFFPTRDCRTMVRPIEDERKLQELDTCPNSELRPCFMDQVIDIRKHVLSHAAPKSISGHAMSGKLFIRMCDSYTKAINRGAAPAIKNTWLLLSESQCRSAMDEAIELANSRLVLRTMPVQLSTVIDVTRMARDEALEHYRKHAFGDETDRFLNRLNKKVDKLEKSLQEKNESALKTEIMSQQEHLCTVLPEIDSFEKLRSRYNDAYKKFLTRYPGFEGSWARCAAEESLWKLMRTYYSLRDKTSQKECAKAKKDIESAHAERTELRSRMLELQNEADTHSATVAESARQLQDAWAQIGNMKEENTLLEARCVELHEKAESEFEALKQQLRATEEEATLAQEQFRNDMLESVKQVSATTGQKEQELETRVLELADLKKQLLELSNELNGARRYGSDMEEKLSQMDILRRKNEELAESLAVVQRRYKSVNEDLTELHEKHEQESTSFRQDALQTINDMKDAQARERVTFAGRLENAQSRAEKLQEDADSKYEILQQQYDRASNQLSRFKAAAEVATTDSQKTIEGLRADVYQLKTALELSRRESVDGLKRAEAQWREQLQKSQVSMNTSQDAHLKTCMDLQKNLHSAESRAQCAETRVEEYAKQLNEVLTNPENANLKTQARELKTSLERAEMELKWTKESKQQSIRQLNETHDRVTLLEKTCKQLESSADKEVTSLKLAYERKISILETRLAEHANM
jgi:hypothetical protein